MADSTIRVRFAPSPTGYLHVGGARSALFNYLFARANNGSFILRIEDTDRTRFCEGALEEIYTSLQWLGIEWDEGPDIGGPCGPYVQSERTDLYRQHARRLIENGCAYRCFCTPERLEQVRREREARKEAQSGYDGHCRHLAPGESERRAAAGEAHVIRLRMPHGRSIFFDDAIRGPVQTDADQLDDAVLIKSDGYPTYHLASVVDDHLMQISHVMRGDEWIASTPRHVFLYESLGWDIPVFAHLPVILAPGGGKLSKRKGAASVLDYQRKGILAPALFNFLTLLGWSPGDDRELLDRREIIESFRLDRIIAKPAVFDEEKLQWMNGQYLAKTESAQILPELIGYWKDWGWPVGSLDEHWLAKVVDELRVRARTLPEVAESARFFLADPEIFDPKAVKKHFGVQAVSVLETLIDQIEQGAPAGTPDEAAQMLAQVASSLKLKTGKVNPVVRIALTGSTQGPGIGEIISLLNRDTLVRRCRRAAAFAENEATHEDKA